MCAAGRSPRRRLGVRPLGARAFVGQVCFGSLSPLRPPLPHFSDRPKLSSRALSLQPTHTMAPKVRPRVPLYPPHHPHACTAHHLPCPTREVRAGSGVGQPPPPHGRTHSVAGTRKPQRARACSHERKKKQNVSPLPASQPTPAGGCWAHRSGCRGAGTMPAHAWGGCVKAHALLGRRRGRRDTAHGMRLSWLSRLTRLTPRLPYFCPHDHPTPTPHTDLCRGLCRRRPVPGGRPDAHGHGAGPGAEGERERT